MNFGSFGVSVKRLGAAYVVAYAVGVTVSLVWSEQSALWPAVAFLVIFAGGTWFAIGAPPAPDSNDRFRRSPVSLMGVGLLLLAVGAGFLAAEFPVVLTELAFLVLAVIPPAFVALSFRFAAFFPSRRPGYGLASVALFLLCFSSLLPTGGPFLAMVLRWVALCILVGAMAGARLHRGVELTLRAGS